MYSCVLFVALLALVRYSSSYEATYAVAMTAIPPRFSSLENTIQSWMNQTIKPIKIFLFIPKKYKRFSGSHTVLNSLLMKSAALQSLVTNNTIHVVPLERDFGPISKFLGILWYLQSFTGFKPCNPDYWIVGDDDVDYIDSVVARYDNSTRTRASRCLGMTDCTENFGLSQFRDVNRQEFDLRKTVNGVATFEHHKILHMQGVDTFMLPRVVVSSAVKLNESMHIVEHLEARCPHAFYQDDYVISFLLHLFKIEMTSIRDVVPFRVIENTTNYNSQMHLEESVKTREAVTKKCILNLVPHAYSYVYGTQYAPT